MKHRCAVCWESQQDHDDWYAHAIQEHGAELAEFGFRRCTRNPRDCVGVQNALKRVGYVIKPRVRPAPSAFTAKDGTTYTPLPLPLDAA